jgi:hypothetical protein
MGIGERAGSLFKGGVGERSGFALLKNEMNQTAAVDSLFRYDNVTDVSGERSGQ